MKALTVDIRESTGRILCCTIFRPSGRKLLGKGHVLNEEDVGLLETEGLPAGLGDAVRGWRGR